MALNAEQKMDVALFRFGLIAPLINNQIENPRSYLESICSRIHDVPHYGRREYSERTLLTWVSAYRQGGLDRLMPSERKDKGLSRTINTPLGEKLIELRQEYAGLSVQLFYDQMLKDGVVMRHEASYHSVYRFLKRHGLHKPAPESKAALKDRKKFAHDQVNRLWQGDMMVGPYLYIEGKKKASYLFAFIDDCSRIIPYACFDTSQNFNAMKSVFVEALIRRGLPQVVYLDNAKVYRSKMFHEACARLKITVAHAEPYDAASKGKIERFFRTVRSRFLPLLPTPLTSLEELNRAFFLWLEQDYHRKIHSSLDMCPLDKYLSQSAQVEMVNDPDMLKRFFLKQEERRVNNDATISLFGHYFEVPAHLIGQKIQVRFNPDDITQAWINNGNEVLELIRPVIAADNAIIKRNQHALSFRDAQRVKEEF